MMSAKKDGFPAITGCLDDNLLHRFLCIHQSLSDGCRLLDVSISLGDISLTLCPENVGAVSAV